MLKIDGECLWSINGDNMLARPESVGKWYFRTTGLSQAMDLIFRIDRLVETGTMYRAKVYHRLYPEKDPFYAVKPVICLYADDDTKERARKLVMALGINTRPVWKYDSQSRIDWAKGGRLYIKVQRMQEKRLKK